MLGTMTPFRDSPLNEGYKAQVIRPSVVAMLNEEFDLGTKPWLTMRLLANAFAVEMDSEFAFGSVTLQENSLGPLKEHHYYLDAIRVDDTTSFLYIYGKEVNDGVLCVRWVKTQRPNDDDESSKPIKTLFKET